MTEGCDPGSLLYGEGSHGRRLKLERVIVLDSSGPRLCFRGETASLYHLNNLRDEAPNADRRARILRKLGSADGPVAKGDLGRAAYGADYGPVHGVLALDMLVRSLTKLFRERFGIEPIRLAREDSWEWAGEGLELREGTISEGRVIDVAD